MSGRNAVVALTDVLRALPATGPNVYDQIRYAREDGAFDTLFLDQTVPATPFVHTWMVTREGTRGADLTMQAAKATHTVVATGFRSFEDNISEALWQAELDTIFGALIGYIGRHEQAAVLTNDAGVVITDDGGAAITTLDGVTYFDWSGPPVIEGVKLVFFGKYLCHTARLIMPFEEFPL